MESGALAQLARALRWQRRGHRFDSDMLHSALQSTDFGKDGGPAKFIIFISANNFIRREMGDAIYLKYQLYVVRLHFKMFGKFLLHRLHK